jgi:broad specificity phosphatase PhoE
MILLRHGQSEFNLHFTKTRRDPGIPDPKLTPLGEEQAEAAAAALAGAGIARIIASPYTRALQTAAPIARALGLPVTVTPDVRERYAFSCDIGSPRAALAQAWPEHDFTAVAERWWPEAPEPEADVVARAGRFRAAMAAHPEWAQTLVISHWGFILCMTGTSVMNGTWLRVDPTEAAPGEIVWRA